MPILSQFGWVILCLFTVILHTIFGHVEKKGMIMMF